MTSIFWSLLLAVVVGASARLCAAADKANFAYSALSGLQAPLWVAKEAGFFKKHDIDAPRREREIDTGWQVRER